MKTVTWALIAVGILLATLVGFDLVARRSPPARTPVALGRAYATTVTVTLADAWIAAAAALEKGQTVPQARTTLQDAWQAERSRAFVADVAPAFARILPEGADPKDAAQRSAIAEAWREFARGLKGGR